MKLMRVGTWPPCPPPLPCGPRSQTGESGGWRVLRGPNCCLPSSHGLDLPPPWVPALNLPPPPPQELLPSTLPGAQALHLHEELVARPAPPPLQCQHYGSHCRQAGQGQAVGGREQGKAGVEGASEGLAQPGSLPCNTQGSLPSRKSPSVTSGPVPALMPQEWVEGPRAT